MRKMLLVVLMATVAVAAHAAEEVSAGDLSEEVAKLHRKSDSGAARALFALQLTERLSAVRLARLEAELPGNDSRRALRAVADRAAFLALPQEDIPALARPDEAKQRVLLARTAEYVKTAIPLLPDFLATETVEQFSDQKPGSRPKVGGKDPDERLYPVAESSATVRFLGGREEVQGSAGPPEGAATMDNRLTVEGVFGPIFSVVQKDILPSNPAWSHWEQGERGPVAVFAYAVAKEKSHYVVQDAEGQGILAPVAAYHGEIGVDPATGAILRLTLIAETRANSPVKHADIAIEYGQRELGGKLYVCPRRSVALSVARDMRPLEGFYVYPMDQQPPFKTEVNDVSYADYHLFRTEIKLLPGDAGVEAPPASKPPPQ